MAPIVLASYKIKKYFCFLPFKFKQINKKWNRKGLHNGTDIDINNGTEMHIESGTEMKIQNGADIGIQ